MSVRRAVAGDEAVLRALRLAALADSPDAFASTLAREEARPVAEWTRWITDAATFVWETPAGARGLAAGVPHRDDATCAFLMSMWVHPDARGTGAGDALVEAVLGWAAAAGYRTVRLHVGKDNAPARRLYARHGFRLTGRELVVEETGVVDVEMLHDPRGDSGGPDRAA